VQSSEMLLRFFDNTGRRAPSVELKLENEAEYIQ